MTLDSQFERRLRTLPCRICGKPVGIDNAKADGDGKAIHDDCYASKIKFEQVSRDGHAVRPWKVIAADVTHEQDPKKMTELLAELNQALEEQQTDGTPKVKTKPDNSNRDSCAIAGDGLNH